ncbi:MAG TPA: DUF2243 domain-containing protein [Rubrivivax sp.]|nr:DUF2243 domain-containing protein [Rubrivivax sp.]
MKPGSDRPLIAAGLLLGAGLGGFFDGIVFHQLLQWHNMLSARIPPVDLLGAKLNMFWDGVFHAAVWLMTVAGLVLLFRAGRPPRTVWSGRTLLGAALMGWGAFNLIEGLVDHHLLQLHHVREDSLNPLPADLAFLASGVVLLVFGWLLVRSARRRDVRN